MTNALHWNNSPGWFIMGGLFVSLIALCSLVCVRRSHLPQRAAVAESLRLALAVAAVCTLLQPEWTRTTKPKGKPRLTVLRDLTGSMSTQDVSVNSDSEGTIISRRDWIERSEFSNIAQRLEDQFEVRVMDFGASETVEIPGTNLLAALDDGLAGDPTTLLLVSDGDWNQGGSPLRAASRFRLRNTPLFVCGVGRETALPDLEITRVAAPAYAIAGEPLRIPVEIRNTLHRSVDVRMELMSLDNSLANSDISIPPLGTKEFPLLWTPRQEGRYALKIVLPVQPDEKLSDNNRVDFSLTVRKENIRVLLIDSLPRWEYRYLRNALMRDPGVLVDCLLYHPTLPERGGGDNYLETFPADPDALSPYDVVFLGDVGLDDNELTRQQLENLRGLIEEHASGLVFLPGHRGRHLTLTNTPLGDLYPVTLDTGRPAGVGARTPAQMALTPVGKNSLLTLLADTSERNPAVWKSLPGFHWHAPVVKSKTGSEVLAVHDRSRNQWGRLPLLVTRSFGQGKVLFMGTDGAWRWRRGVEDKYHYRFWGQVARWMAYQRHMAAGKQVRLTYLPERPKAGDTLSFRATVMNAGGGPLQNADVRSRLIAPDGTIREWTLESAGGEWGVYAGKTPLPLAGEYTLETAVPSAGITHKVTIETTRPDLEKIGRPARFDELRQIATETGGFFTPFHDIDPLLEALQTVPSLPSATRTTALWSHPLWLTVILLLFCAFWLARKWAGAV